MKPMIALLALLVTTAAPAWADEENEIVGRFIALDGDTLLAPDGQTRVRLAGIEAPEMSRLEGWYSRMHLNSITSTFELTCRVIGKDNDGRRRAHCSWPYSDNQRLDVGYTQVLNGYAVQHRLYSDDAELSAAEASACVKRWGLWAHFEPGKLCVPHLPAAFELLRNSD